MPDVRIEKLYIQINPDRETDPVAQSYEDIVDLLDEAIDNNEAVKFLYEPSPEANENALTTLRTLTPSVIQDARDGEQAVLGHDHDRGAARQFRIDRIVGVTIDETVEPYRG